MTLQLVRDGIENVSGCQVRLQKTFPKTPCSARSICPRRALASIPACKHSAMEPRPANFNPPSLQDPTSYLAICGNVNGILDSDRLIDFGICPCQGLFEGDCQAKDRPLCRDRPNCPGSSSCFARPAPDRSILAPCKLLMNRGKRSHRRLPAPPGTRLDRLADPAHAPETIPPNKVSCLYRPDR